MCENLWCLPALCLYCNFSPMLGKVSYFYKYCTSSNGKAFVVSLANSFCCKSSGKLPSGTFLRFLIRPFLFHRGMHVFSWTSLRKLKLTRLEKYGCCVFFVFEGGHIWKRQAAVLDSPKYVWSSFLNLEDKTFKVILLVQLQRFLTYDKCSVFLEWHCPLMGS